MVIYDMACDGGHRFEGWFKDLQACEAQAAAGEVQCPSCGSSVVSRQLTGSAIRRSAEDRAGTALVPAAPTPAPVATHAQAPEGPPDPARVREFLGMLAAHVRANTEDVGARFATEARKIHEGETAPRAIRGTATPEEEQALVEDEIPFARLPDTQDS